MLPSKIYQEIRNNEETNTYMILTYFILVRDAAERRDQDPRDARVAVSRGSVQGCVAVLKNKV